MPSIREVVQQKPWIGWAVALVLFGVSELLIYPTNKPSGGYSADRLREIVTIRFSDTGEELTMGRGDFERRLRLESSGLIDPAKGLLNPKTNQNTGFLVDVEGWNKTVERINQERKKLGTDTSGASTPRPGMTVQPTAPADQPAAPAASPQPK